MDADAAGPVTAADEGRHEPGAGPWWCERWWFCWWDGASRADGTAGFVELVLLPNQRRSWYRSALVRRGEPLLAVVDHEAPLPRVGLELRSTGLWADHTVEAPLAQWTVANEAFALAVDDPDELVGRGYGTPTPLALDAEWYADAPPTRLPAGYAQRGTLEGTVELGGGARLEVREALAERAHTWGPLTLPPVATDATAGLAGVPDRWPAPFDAVVDDVVTAEGWRRFLRPR